MKRLFCVFLLLLFLVPLVSASAIMAGAAVSSSTAAVAAQQHTEQQAFIAAGQTGRTGPSLTIQNTTIPEGMIMQPNLWVVLDRFVWADNKNGITVKIAFWQPSTGNIIGKNVFLGDYYLGRYDPGSIIRYENGFVNDRMEDTGLNVGDA